jgi:Icc-related predicted phosphoesterase
VSLAVVKETRRMRCLLAADLHYSLQQFDWVNEVAGNFDIVVLAGDHLDLASVVDYRAQSAVVKNYIGKVQEQTQLLVCSGNHDLDTRDQNGEKISRWILDVRGQGVPSDGDSFVHADTLFTMCPWWDGPTVRSRIDTLLAENAKKRLQRWIWVHHAPPARSPTSWDGKTYRGDVELEQWIGKYSPDAVLCGHVHQSPFRPGGSWVDLIGSTWVFNAGRQYGRPPTHIILDSAHQTAFWFSEAGNQSVRLDQGPVRVKDLTELPDWLTLTRRDRDPSLD